MLGPRKDYIHYDDMFMSIAIIMSMRSKDPNTIVGACLVDKDNRIIGTGYNGFPRDIDANALPWDREGSLEDTKYAYISHAEDGCIDNCDKNRLKGSKLYVTLFPCNKCAIRIIQNQIKEVVYLSDKYHDSPEAKAARRMFKLAGIKIRKFKPAEDKIIIKLK